MGLPERRARIDPDALDAAGQKLAELLVHLLGHRGRKHATLEIRTEGEQPKLAVLPGVLQLDAPTSGFPKHLFRRQGAEEGDRTPGRYPCMQELKDTQQLTASRSAR